MSLTHHAKTVAIVQARVSSTRLPEKVLKEINGFPMLYCVLARLRRAELIDESVVACPEGPKDEEIVRIAAQAGVRCIRGSETDVLGRYLLAARATEADVIVRLTADCPLLDSSLIDACIELRQAKGAQYASNVHPRRTFPRGLDCEVLTRRTLEYVASKATSAQDREHVTTYIREASPLRFHRVSLVCPRGYSHNQWSVDTAEDLERVRTIYRHFWNRDFDFTWEEALKFADPITSYCQN